MDTNEQEVIFIYGNHGRYIEKQQTVLLSELSVGTVSIIHPREDRK
jgi:metallophosphoesterase superfamily enzyme